MTAVTSIIRDHYSPRRDSLRISVEVKSWPAPTTMLIAVLAAIALAGCTTKRRGIPARSMQAQSSVICCGQDEPINFLMLRQDPPDSYRVAARDVLGVYIEGILGDRTEPPPVHFPEDESQQPAIGYPTPIRDDGTVSLPLVAPILVEGLTLPEVERAILARYSQDRILLEQRQRIIVTLMKRRTYQVLVVREDQGLPLANLSSETMLMGTNKRGMAYAVDLPAYENDVLHALSKTGGLPGHDAKNELIVLRGGFDPELNRRGKLPLLLNPVSGEEIVFDGEVTDIDRLPLDAQPIPIAPDEDSAEGIIEAIPQPETMFDWYPQPFNEERTERPDDVQQYITAHGNRPNTIRIPLRIGNGEESPELQKSDIILKTGDIVFVRSREKEVFYTGGVLKGGQHALPRDYQIDVLEAIALAGGSIGPAAGGSDQGSSSGRTTAVFPATRIIILRRRGHQQIPIEVDLRRAFRDPRERIKIEPGDFITLEYRVHELTANMLLSTLRLNWFLSSFD